ncbi:SAM-dependent methyltransferase [Aquabacter sp. CN5-332]|uniref:class I SAM-dependent DNA methyltransferase n=1 Tax=Aquabacter sp. CN5-332 TaxID=3156608 RepID=UPI0032B55B5B
MTRPAASLPSAYFETLYSRNPDPWNFETSAYERTKYRATLAALPHTRYAAALEVGCSIGVLTELLAQRCDDLLAVDASERALDRAIRRCRSLTHIRFAQCRVPDEWPQEAFDLILLSEVIYYLDRADVCRLAARVKTSLRQDGHVLLVHWIGDTDYPLSGDEASELFIAEMKDTARQVKGGRTDRYRLDCLEAD